MTADQQEFYLVLRRALLMIVRWIEKKLEIGEYRPRD
jgi:hypothetical protein